jgi:hypothetical protein
MPVWEQIVTQKGAAVIPAMNIYHLTIKTSDPGATVKVSVGRVEASDA